MLGCHGNLAVAPIPSSLPPFVLSCLLLWGLLWPGSAFHFVFVFFMFAPQSSGEWRSCRLTFIRLLWYFLSPLPTSFSAMSDMFPTFQRPPVVTAAPGHCRPRLLGYIQPRTPPFFFLPFLPFFCFGFHMEEFFAWQLRAGWTWLVFPFMPALLLEVFSMLAAFAMGSEAARYES